MIQYLILLKIHQNKIDIKWISLRWFIGFLIIKTSSGAFKNKNISIKDLAEELRKLIIKKFEKRKLYSSFIDNIWSSDLVNL